MTEQPVCFPCRGLQLPGIIHHGESEASLGVLIVVGGPQYRVGSHRQFVQLARHLAETGIPVMRFDVPGMGDSSGEKASFEAMDDAIRAACDSLFRHVAGLERVALWGLCDGASAALMYGTQDSRIAGLILLNPWLEDSEAKARAQVSGYYSKRLMNRELWLKLLRGELKLLSSVSELLRTLWRAFFGREESRETDSALTYQQRMLQGYQGFSGSILILLSGNDLTAKEFELQFTSDSKSWRQDKPRHAACVKRLDDADHTFSTRDWKRWVEQQTESWLRDIAQVK